MLRKTVAIISLGLFLALAVAACSNNAPATPRPNPTVSVTRGTSGSGERIIAEGKVTPAKYAALAFTMPGTVMQVSVALGDRVQAGQTLAQLDTRALELQVTQADANLALAQARLNQLLHPSDTDLAAAKNNVVAAQAVYDKLKAGGSASDVAAAQGALAAAQQNLARVQAGPTADQLAQLKAAIDNAKAALDGAQAAYDKIGGASNPNIGMLPQSAQLQQATNNYIAAQGAYNEARAHPTAAELASALAQVQQAQAALDRLTPDNAQLAQSLAALQTAQSQLAKLQQPSTDDRAALQAGVSAAQAARDLAAEQVKNGKLVAPFAGTVITLDVKQGEYAAPGAPVVRIADTSAWQVETTDLTELNIARVSEGSNVTMTFDAIPGLELAGKVTAIRTFGELKQGDTVYTVICKPDQQDPRLRWNMTAKVSLEAK